MVQPTAIFWFFLSPVRLMLNANTEGARSFCSYIIFVSTVAGWRRCSERWRTCSHLVHLVEALLHTLRVKACHLTHHSMGLHCWATLMHNLETMGSRATTTSPSTWCWNGRDLSPSELKSSSTLVYTMWSYSRELGWTKFPTIFHTIGWEKLYDAPCSGSHLLTLEFLTSFNSFTRGRKSYVHFFLFRREFKFEFSRFSELKDFSSSCLLEEKNYENF
jgi:hypothetical protein